MHLPSPKPLFSRLIRGVCRIHENESGQGLVFAAITLLMLTYFAGAVYRVGYLSSQKMKVQSATDAAAYSMALTQANGLSALAWINEGMAATHYQMMKYAVDVIVAAVDQEFILDPAQGDASSPRRGPDFQPDPNVTASDRAAAKQRYQNAYQVASANIPTGKEYLKKLNDLQKQIIDRMPENILRAAAHIQMDVSPSAREGYPVGGAFAMTEGGGSRRGVRLATFFPDYEDFHFTKFLNPETNSHRFGLWHGVQPSRHPNDMTLPAWISWFDAGQRGSDPGLTYQGYANFDGHYYDIERTGTYRSPYWRTYPVRRTFARMGRLYNPHYHGPSADWPDLQEQYPGERVDIRGRGYEVGDTALKVSSLVLFKDRSGINQQPQPQNANNPYMCPFYIRVSGGHTEPAAHRGYHNTVEIYIVERVDEATNTLHLREGLRQPIWLWNESQCLQQDNCAGEPPCAHGNTTSCPSCPRFYRKEPNAPAVTDDDADFDLITDERLPCDYWERNVRRDGTHYYYHVVRGDCLPDPDDADIYFWRGWPHVERGRYLVYQDKNGACHKEFYPVYLGIGAWHWEYCQTRGPCWDTREIKMSQDPPDADQNRYFYGATGYIYDPTAGNGRGGVRACPTCGYVVLRCPGCGWQADERVCRNPACRYNGIEGVNGWTNNYWPGVDYDGDRKTDVRIFPWHVFYLQEPEGLDETDYMDVRVFKEMNEFNDPDITASDRFAVENDTAYGVEAVDAPWVLTADFFKWGMNAALWMPKPTRDFILPANWEPQWGYFAFASARPALRDTYLGRWVMDPADHLTELRNAYPDDTATLVTGQDARDKWVETAPNLYLPEWQGRLVHARDVIKSFDAQPEGFLNGLQLLLDRLIVSNTRTYDDAGTVYDAVLNGSQTAPTPSFGTMSAAVAELINPTSPDQHGMDITNPDLEERVHH
jgi:hypothetical protein